MLIHSGVQDRVINEVTTVAGTTSREGSVQSPALLASLYVNSISSGTLTVSVYTLTDPGREVLLFTFPVISAPTPALILQKSSSTLQRFRIQATYTGVCDYEVYIRASESAGTSDVTILGQPIEVIVSSGDINVTIIPPSAWSTSQVTVTTTPSLLIAASIADRKGILIKNWSTISDVFIGESLGAATSLLCYPLSARDAVALDLTAGSSVYAATASGTADIRIVQAGS